MRYIVTGATSFIGKELCSCLLSRGHNVTAVCRRGSRGIADLPAGCSVVLSEMADYGSLDGLIPSADAFINLAWEGTGHDGRDNASVQEDNIRNSCAAMDSARKIGCRLFVESGSQAEYGETDAPQREGSGCNPFSEYGKAKLRIKNQGFEFAEANGMKYLHLRIFSIFGEEDHPWTLVMSAVGRMLRNEPMELSSCDQNWNFLYVRDAAEMIARLCDHAIDDGKFVHETYNVASKDTRELREFVEEIKTIVKSSSRLDYGAIHPERRVSLQPDITKTMNAVGDMVFSSFKDVIERIADGQKRKNNDL